MNWAKGFSAAYYMSIVDPTTWRDTERVRIKGGSASKSRESDLIESARIECDEFEEKTEKWVRVWMDTVQDGEDPAHVPLFTGLASVPKETIRRRKRETPLECYSVLKPADDIPLQRGWYAPAGIPASQICIQLLKTTPALVVSDLGSPELSQAIIAEDSETHLTMVLKILKAIGWRLRIDGYGVIRICRQPEEPAAVLGTANDVMETTIDIEPDWFECPNVFRATSDDMTAIARDDDPKSIYSTVSRGREVWSTETDCDLNDGESIEEYAARRLKEEQAMMTKIHYSRRFDPDVLPGDMIRLHYPEHGLQGDYTVHSMTVEFGHGGRTEEEVHG